MPVVKGQKLATVKTFCLSVNNRLFSLRCLIVLGLSWQVYTFRKGQDKYHTTWLKLSALEFSSKNINVETFCQSKLTTVAWLSISNDKNILYHVIYLYWRATNEDEHGLASPQAWQTTCHTRQSKIQITRTKVDCFYIINDFFSSKQLTVIRISPFFAIHGLQFFHSGQCMTKKFQRG